MKCAKFTEERRTFNQNIGTAFPEFRKMDGIEKFVFIMQGKYIGLVQILATFLKSITEIRGNL